jgi:hypothetical protein
MSLVARFKAYPGYGPEPPGVDYRDHLGKVQHAEAVRRCREHPDGPYACAVP